MKKRILLILFIVNTLLLFVYLIPSLQEITHIFFNKEAVSVGVIGGIDGPTAIYIASEINWFPIIAFSIEVILGIYLFYKRSKK